MTDPADGLPARHVASGLLRHVRRLSDLCAPRWRTSDRFKTFCLVANARNGWVFWKTPSGENCFTKSEYRSRHSSPSKPSLQKQAFEGRNSGALPCGGTRKSFSIVYRQTLAVGKCCPRTNDCLGEAAPQRGHLSQGPLRAGYDMLVHPFRISPPSCKNSDWTCRWKSQANKTCA